MSGIETFLAEADIREFAATPAGIDLLESSTQLQEAVAGFTDGNQPNGEVLGAGRFGVVVGVGDIALKMATRRTNTYAAILKQPSDLITQFKYMAGLHHYTATEAAPQEHNIHAPQHYFALRTRKGYMGAQQLVSEAETLNAWSTRHADLDAETKTDMLKAVSRRVDNGVGQSPLAIGLTDVFKSDPAYVSHDNLLLPAGTEYPHTEPLYIIDQPGPASGGAVEAAARLASIYLTETAGRGNRRSVLRHYRA